MILDKMTPYDLNEVFTKMLCIFFQLYDKDCSGTIEMSEMVEVLETVYVMEGLMSGNMARERAKQIFDELDIDGDGTLTCDEFVNGCLKDKDMVAMLKQSNTPPTTDQE